MSKNGDKFSTFGGELLMVGYNLSLSSTEEPLFNFYLLFLFTRLMKKNPQQLLWIFFHESCEQEKQIKIKQRFLC